MHLSCSLHLRPHTKGFQAIFPSAYSGRGNYATWVLSVLASAFILQLRERSLGPLNAATVTHSLVYLNTGIFFVLHRESPL